MNSRHIQILLDGCHKGTGKSYLNNVKVIGDNRHVTYVAGCVLVFIAPWLLDTLKERDLDETCLVVPNLNISRFSTFLKQLFTFDLKSSSESRNTFYWQDFLQSLVHVSDALHLSNLDSIWNLIETQPNTALNESHKLSKSTTEISRLARIEVCNNDEVEVIPTIDIGTQTSFYLSEVDPLSLEDDVILSNFCDQDQRLVCLVCYKIFPSIDQDLVIFKQHLSSHKKASLRKVKVHQRPSRSESPCYSDDLHDYDSEGDSKFDLENERKDIKSKNIIDHEPKTLQVFHCTTCSRQFSNLAGLTSHLKSHEEKQFSCTICKKQFQSKKRFDSHLKIGKCSKNDRKCQHCNKVYATVSALNLHISKLGGDKPFVCSVCKKAFSEHRSLKEHYLTHRKERQHACKQCDKTFVQKNHLLYHMASIHNRSLDGGTSKHVCKICSQSFAFPFLLRKHEAAHVKRLVNHFKHAERESSEVIKSKSDLKKPKATNMPKIPKTK